MADSMSGLYTVSNTSAEDSTDSDGHLDNHEGELDGAKEGDWFSEVGSDAGNFEDAEWELDRSLEDEETHSKEVDMAASMHHHRQVADNVPHVEIYDSGTTHHLLPYQNDFSTFIETPAKPLCTANKHSFSATGVGQLKINIPNGMDKSQLMLMEVLYFPKVSYTLVSIGKLDDLGYKVTFGDGVCRIVYSDGMQVGEVLKNVKGFYHIEHNASGDSANVIETIMLDKLHHHMGHMSPAIAKQLVENGFVTGVCLEKLSESGEPFFCELCIYAKVMRKPVPKERGGERAKEFGEEIHSNLWGPAPGKTAKNGCI